MLMKPVIYYCYDAYCGWCYGFSPVVKRLAEDLKDVVSFEVLSGGMIPADNPRHISVMADYISKAYQRVEELAGVKFGEDYLWHIFNPDKSDWYPHSEKAAIALCIFKEIFPEKQVEFTTDLQLALHFEGRDLTDDEAYRHLIGKYGINDIEFYKKLHSEEYREKAHYEFALCRQLQVTAFPVLLLQAEQTKFFLISRGYTHFDDVKARIDRILNEINGDS